MTLARFLRGLGGHWFARSAFVSALLLAAGALGADAKRPNIFVAMADDWGFPHAGIYGDPVVQTPTFDRLAREGVLFRRAYVSSPSCTPSRSALMTGQYHWRLEEAANLWSTLQPKFRSYAEVLAEAGYTTGCSRKSWGPGRIEAGGRKQDPMGPRFKSFAEFLRQRPVDKPFCFWFGSPDPHRPYTWRSGADSGMDLSRIKLPACFPDNETVRADVADYYFEVQRFDREVGEALRQLKDAGEWDRTIVVMTGDHGMPFPRGKSNLYDLGARVPLAIRWPGTIQPGRTVDDFVSFVDLAPTFLEAAGLKPLTEMTGRSLLPVLASPKSGWVDAARDQVIYGKERHVPAQEKGNTAGYPSRALRTADFLYIRNFRPELWPNGIADGTASEKGNAYADCDDGPTKTFIVEHKDDPAFQRYFDLSFARRPAEELYDLKKDPNELQNVAGNPEYSAIQKKLSARLTAALRATADPRVIGGAEKFETYPYYGERLRPASARKAP